MSRKTRRILEIRVAVGRRKENGKENENGKESGENGKEKGE